MLNTMEIEQILSSQVVGRLACRYGDSQYIVPISYAYDGEYVYCHTQEGLKVRLMREHRKVCFEVESMPDMANWRTVIAWGEFEELKDWDSRMIAMNKLHERILPMISSETLQLSVDWPFSPTELDRIPGVTFRIRLLEKSGRFEKAEPTVFFGS